MPNILVVVESPGLNMKKLADFCDSCNKLNQEIFVRNNEELCERCASKFDYEVMRKENHEETCLE